MSIQCLILLSIHSAVYGTFRYLTYSTLFAFPGTGNKLLHLGKAGAAHLIVQVQSDGHPRFKPIYQCTLRSEEHQQLSQQGSEPQMEVFGQ
jgi:hypothetical protein